MTRPRARARAGAETETGEFARDLPITGRRIAVDAMVRGALHALLCRQPRSHRRGIGPCWPCSFPLCPLSLHCLPSSALVSAHGSRLDVTSFLQATKETLANHSTEKSNKKLRPLQRNQIRSQILEILGGPSLGLQAHQTFRPTIVRHTPNPTTHTSAEPLHGMHGTA